MNKIDNANITLKEIIERKIKFSNAEYLSNKEEFQYTHTGEINAYNEMLLDIETLDQREFYQKYLKIVEPMNDTLRELEREDDSQALTSNEYYKVNAYTSVINDILYLIYPEYYLNAPGLIVTGAKIKRTKTSELTLREIIERKAEFSKNYIVWDEEYIDGKDFGKCENAGKQRAYAEILQDVCKLSEIKFIEKYIEITRYLSKTMVDQEVGRELAELCEYSNTCLMAVTLIEPKYMFEIEE